MCVLDVFKRMLKNRMILFSCLCLWLGGCRYAHVVEPASAGSDIAAQIANLLPLEQVEESFAVLPSECRTVYDAELLKMRDATTTFVIRYDINRDGQDELLAWDGNPGTGGGGWFVFVRDGQSWREAGAMSGTPCGRADGKAGIFASWALGWDAEMITYYELEGFDLIQKVAYDVEYAEPIRQKPIKIQTRGLIN